MEWKTVPSFSHTAFKKKKACVDRTFFRVGALAASWGNYSIFKESGTFGKLLFKNTKM